MSGFKGIGCRSLKLQKLDVKKILDNENFDELEGHDLGGSLKGTQEVRILGEVSDEVDEILTLVFENYKSLDESSPSGIVDVFGSVTGVAALALPPAFKLYKLLHDIISPEAQLKLCRYFQVRILGKVSDEVDEILTLVFENYKSLDESSPSGLVDVFGSVTGVAALALPPALKLYKLLHDIISPEAQLKLCRYFQNATKKRSRRHLSETDEFVSNNNENILMDPVALSTAYKKMKSLCVNIRREILTDIEIHKQDLLSSFIDLPNLSSSIYSTEIFGRLRVFLVSCPPAGPILHVVELVLSTADFQRDLASWNISPIKGEVDAKELFHTYITFGSKIGALRCLNFVSLTRCNIMSVKSPSVPTQHTTTSFIDDVYNRIKQTLVEYDVIIS